MPARYRRVALLAAGLLLLVVVAAGLGFWRLADEIAADARSVAADRAQVDAATRLLATLQDAETGQRGFLLTGEHVFLEPYDRARTTAAADLADLAAATQPQDRDRLPRITTLVERKLAELAEVLNRREAGDPAGALALMRTGEGRALMDALRDELGLLRGRAAERRAANAARFSANQAWLVGGVSGILLLAALALGAALLVALQGERRARARSDDLASVIHTLRDGLLAVDARGRITASNALFCELAGVPVALCAAGQPFAALEALDRDNAAPMLGGAATASRDGRQLEIWSAERTGGGKVWLVADVTRRTMAEAAARDASRMEAMGQLTGGLAHDFNNLLQVILASLDALDREAAPVQRRRLEAMRDAANRGARLVRSLLAFARRQPLAPVPTDPNALVRDLADMVRQTVGEAIEVRTVLAAGAWPVLVDPVQLESALLNLAANARDAMPQGGHLTIEVANISADPAWAAQAQVPPGDYSLIAVSDTGTGMSPDVAARAFDPFFTTRAEAGGNGLGLSMVHGFARQSGGHARIYSEPGRGTTVKLILPRAAVEAALPRPPLPPVRHGNGERILLVEDNAAVRQATAEVIAELGYVVGQAANGTDALEMLRHERWDVLFTDVVMPGGIGGPELARQAAARQPGIRALFTSGYTQNGIVHGGRLDPGVRLVSKPAGRDELARALSATLAEGPQQLTVLVVDDEPLIRLAAAEALAEAGHRVSEAGTAAEARVAADRTPPDVLVADLALPDGDGLALARELSARFPALRVVIASGRAPVSAGDEARMWLLKPYRSEELIAAVQRR